MGNAGRAPSILGVMAKLRKATITFVMSVRQSVCPHGKKNSAPTGPIFIKFGISGFFENPARKFTFN